MSETGTPADVPQPLSPAGQSGPKSSQSETSLRPSPASKSQGQVWLRQQAQPSVPGQVCLTETSRPTTHVSDTGLSPGWSGLGLLLQPATRYPASGPSVYQALPIQRPAQAQLSPARPAEVPGAPTA